MVVVVIVILSMMMVVMVMMVMYDIFSVHISLRRRADSHMMGWFACKTIQSVGLR